MISDDLGSWIEREYAIAARGMLRSVSATGLEHLRPALGQAVRAARGSVLASPVSAHYDPEPDYFFHWLRDSAAVISAVDELVADGTVGKVEGRTIFADFIQFSLALDGLDGRTSLRTDDGHTVQPEARQFLRPPGELALVFGDRIRMEARYNPDGTLDVLKWGRPQLDGPAFRALAVMRFLRRHGGPAEARRLVEEDITFTMRHAGEESFDIWEERRCADYYTRSLQARALSEAADLVSREGDAGRADEMRAAAMRLEGLLDGHWSPERHAYRSAAGETAATDRDIDFAVVLAAIHAARPSGAHSVLDPHMQATLATLCTVFSTDYAINRARPDAAPAMGRYRGDVYQSGGAFYFSTLGAAEFHYRLAEALRPGRLGNISENAAFRTQAGVARKVGPASEVDAVRLVARGDAFMDTVHRFTPADGALSEQFDQTDGRQTSARHLAWSYAAFITATAARRRAIAVQREGLDA